MGWERRREPDCNRSGGGRRKRLDGNRVMVHDGASGPFSPIDEPMTESISNVAERAGQCFMGKSPIDQAMLRLTKTLGEIWQAAQISDEH